MNMNNLICKRSWGAVDVILNGPKENTVEIKDLLETYLSTVTAGDDLKRKQVLHLNNINNA